MRLLEQSAALTRDAFALNRRTYFYRQLAKWLYPAQWHYRTLLAAVIECVSEVPDDCDALINELLLQHPSKPSEQCITDFLQSSTRLLSWFNPNTVPPTVIRLNLSSAKFIGRKSNQKHTPPALGTIGDLADWLRIDHSELYWFAQFRRLDVNASEALKHYHYQLLIKRDGSPRLIEKPGERLKTIQRKINQEILSSLTPHHAAHGFCKGRGCMSHASIHSGKQYLMSFDIANCFQSIEWSMVKPVFTRMGYADKVATYLTALCTHSVIDPKLLTQFDATQRQLLKQRHLPQGAPGSPALSNAVLQRLDQRLTGLAKHLNLSYSRYADDIAVSGNEHRDWRFLSPLIGGICLDEKVSLNHRKTRIKRSHQKQRLVGLVVNEKPNIDRKQYDALKATVTNCVHHGLENQNRNNHPNFHAHLWGRIQYVKSVNLQRGLKLEKMFQNIEIDTSD